MGNLRTGGCAPFVLQREFKHMTRRAILLLSMLSVVLSSSLLQAQTATEADFNGNGKVDFPDFIEFAQAFGSSQAKYDLDGNGTVDFPDFLAFARFFGQDVQDIPQVITFADSRLEAAVRDAINKPEGDIRESDVSGLTALHAKTSGIASLDGIENLTSLTVLDLRKNQISDISPLSNLTSLMVLDLFRNQIIDISPLSNLISLTDLDLSANQISDILNSPGFSGGSVT